VTQTANEPELNGSVKSLYAPIRQELLEVERILRSQLRSDYPFVDEVVRYGGRLGGKRLRPALLLLTAKAIGEVTSDHLVLAAVLEMIHTATLVHDDVLDEADVRRHLATVNARWNNQTSVLLGDFLFTHAFYLASTLGSTLACRSIGQATNIVCEGELRQTGNQGRYELSEAEYIAIINAKTAELCACCCQLGATFAGAAEDLVERMARYGRSLGIAFQIADDLLDIVGDERDTGKSLGTDLDKQRPTLPLIHLWRSIGPPERKTVAAILEGPPQLRRDALAKWFARAGSTQYAQHCAASYASRARGELSTLKPSAARSVLQQLTYFVVSRSQ
jgi:octaprenyl-diphosphate synthase